MSAASTTARKLGVASAIGIVLLSIAYAIPLAAGFLTLKSPEQPIGDPWFSMLEILIILTAPLMVTLMVAIHIWAPTDSKPFSLSAVVFMAMAAGLTCSVHFVILTMSRQTAFDALPGRSLLLSFNWPSVPYALDILAWDLFFALSTFFLAPVFRGRGLAMSIRVLLVVSGLLSLAGLSGVAVGSMQVRNIGIIGYAAVFPVAALLIALFFSKGRTGKA